MTTVPPNELLAGLTAAQVEAVTTTAAPLCILAGAGSGKTRVLTRRMAWRIAEGQAAAAHVLALTFTRRAADELSTRLAVLGVREQVAAGTFHAIAYAQLRRHWADAGERPPTLLDRKIRLLARLLPARRSPSDPGPAELAGEIEWAQARMV
ncbi:MAG: UvrD-helicase domain-containing protein, partial [Actinomycetota bacterium]|nr:UvrD-helicase domain-containing protein [Actinomycetota bacterium]